MCSLIKRVPRYDDLGCLGHREGKADKLGQETLDIIDILIDRWLSRSRGREPRKFATKGDTNEVANFLRREFWFGEEIT